MIHSIPRYSIIVPVYNRPEELNELLLSLTSQSYKNFEVIIVEDGSEIDSEEVSKSYHSLLNLSYFKKPNSGPGLSRNYGAELAKGEIFIFFDSDCVIPTEYMAHVESFVNQHHPDSFGGPDRFHKDFTPVQRAIGFTMSSFITTGGIRGGSKSMEKFHPRSFNMGFTKEVFNKTKGFSSIRFGEDIDLSIRIKQAGFSSMLIPDAYVYHKRRTDFRKFFKQVYNSGIARINLYKRHPGSLKLVHFLPAGFTIYTCLAVFLSIVFLDTMPLLPLGLFILLVLFSSFATHKNFRLSFLSLIASFVQLIGYGSGFIEAVWKRIVLGKEEFEAFKKNFYK